MGGSSSSMKSDKLMEQMFNMKFMAKQMNRSAVNCEKEEKAERIKIKKAIEKGNMEGAKIHCGNAIRKKNEALTFMKHASRLDAVASRLKTQGQMMSVNKNMVSVTNQLAKCLKSANLEQITHTMGLFEKQFETLDMHDTVVNQAMSNQAAMSTPDDQVQALMRQVADEHNLEIETGMARVPTGGVAQRAAQAEDDVAARMAQLRGP